MRTAVTDALDAAGVPYLVREHAEPALTCEAAAAQRGVRTSQIVKCMLGASEADALVAMLIPGDKTLKISRARKWLRAERLELVDPARISAELGLVVGAISPVQLLGKARMLLDPTVLDEAMVDISSGDPLAGVELSSTDLRDLLGAELVAMVSTRS